MAAQVVKWWKAKLLNGYRHISVILPSEADLRAASDTEQLLGREEDRASTATPTTGLPNRPPMTPRTSVLLVSRPSNGGKDESDNTDASHLRCQEVQCDVSLEMNDSEDASDTPKEFSFTLYDLEGHGKISKDDVAGLVRTIYDALGLSVRLSPAKSKTVHVKLVVSAEKEKEKEREKDSSEENHYDPNTESNSHAAVAEKLANVAAKLNNLPSPSSCCLKKDVNLNVLTEQRPRKCWESPRSSYRRKKDKEQAVDSRTAPCAVVDDYCNCRECRAVVPNPTPEYLVKNILDHPNLEVNNSNKPTPKSRLANASSPRRSRRKCCAHDHPEQVSKFSPEDFEECHPLLEPLEALRANLKRNNFNVSHHRSNANSNAEADYWRWRVPVDPVDEYGTHPHSQHPTPRRNGRMWSAEQAEHESHCRTAPLPPFCGCQQQQSQSAEGKCGTKLTKGVLKEKHRHWEAKQAEEVTWKEYAEPMTSPWRTRAQNHVHNHGSPLHQLKHKNRERDHARAMAQVAHWLVREHLANANDEAGTEADAEDDESEVEEEDCGPKTTPTPPAGKARRGGVARHEHHHVHYHHHYYHYAQSA